MRDDQESAVVIREESHKPRLGVHVEVVRGLVEEQCRGLSEKDPGQLNTPPLSSGHGGHRLIEVG